ncbi:uncharacterized protein LOC132706911 isoform X2 [Cylas formicarius]|uniref:uncharacterized protein LOC132706911 isoform X2 n=1 Tax=Cylas formicarius TaxID=197179 RepID=UPI0029587F42|nr:uncharacterized protein LOC132706911 isoform X2 [Cylas formicarius]
MGCASSAPIVESGKNLVETAKETAAETVAKGERVILNAGEAAKESVESVKETVHNAVASAEESLGKIGDAFSFASNKVQEAADEVDVVGNGAEAVSEAETVLASEADHVREAFASKTTPFFETVRSVEEDVAAPKNGEEKYDMLGEDVEDDVARDAEELLGEDATTKQEECTE